MKTRTRRKKLSNEVSEGIIALIETGKIKIGLQLPTENELIEMFEVSRTSVREAVKSLVALGVLEVRQGVGTFVTSAPPGPLRALPGNSNHPDRSNLLAILEFRLIYEPEAAALAALRATPDDIEELHRCVAELEIGVAARVKPPEDLGFHLAIARATKNSAIVDVSNLTYRFYQNDLQLPDEMDVLHHRSICNAITIRDPEAARTAMKEHLAEIERRYLAIDE